MEMANQTPAQSQKSPFWQWPLVFVMLMWVMYWADQRFDLHLFQLGVHPRTFHGLVGLLTTPFVHGSLSHLVSNTFPILLLGSGIVYFYHQSAFRIFILSIILSGLGVWLFGRPTFHIGASGVVYAWAFFIFFSGLLRGHPQLIALSFLVAFAYGSLIWGLLPVDDNISYEAHISGSVVGILTAFIHRNTNPEHLKKHFWQSEEPSLDEEETSTQSHTLSEQMTINYEYKPPASIIDDQQNDGNNDRMNK